MFSFCLLLSSVCSFCVGMVDNSKFAVVLVVVAVCRTLKRYPEAAPTKKVMKKGRSFTIAYVIVFYRCLLVTKMNNPRSAY